MRARSRCCRPAPPRPCRCRRPSERPGSRRPCRPRRAPRARREADREAGAGDGGDAVALAADNGVRRRRRAEDDRLRSADDGDRLLRAGLLELGAARLVRLDDAGAGLAEGDGRARELADVLLARDRVLDLQPGARAGRDGVRPADDRALGRSRRELDGLHALGGGRRLGSRRKGGDRRPGGRGGDGAGRHRLCRRVDRGEGLGSDALATGAAASVRVSEGDDDASSPAKASSSEITDDGAGGVRPRCGAEAEGCGRKQALGVGEAEHGGGVPGRSSAGRLLPSSIPSTALWSEIEMLSSASPSRPGSSCRPGEATPVQSRHAATTPTI